eukprot:1136584-Rhodomonas_salina.1
MSKSFGYGRTQLTSLTANRSIRQLADPLPKQSPVHAPSFLKTSKQPILNTRVWSLSSSLSSVPERHAVLSSVPRSLLHATACVREQKSQDPASSLYHIEQDGTGNYIVASQDIRAGTVILTETGTVEKAASKYSVQLGEGEHLLMPGDIKLANHSCNSAANCIFELHKQPTPHGRLVAMRDIKAGDSLAFDYETTEWVSSENTTLLLLLRSVLLQPSCVLSIPSPTPLIRQPSLRLFHL